jgi:phage terminase large subunit-like protein
VRRQMEDDHCKIAAKYSRDVLAGKIPACQWVRLACQRQVDELKKSAGAYRFDKAQAARVCRFIEAEGNLLEPWQCFVITTVVGWVDSDGRPRAEIREDENAD